jgi:hypothetical protein
MADKQNTFSLQRLLQFDSHVFRQEHVRDHFLNAPNSMQPAST